MSTPQRLGNTHALGCPCSVCWAHLFADALDFMPYTEAEKRLYTDYLTYYDYTAEFKLKMRTRTESDQTVRIKLAKRF